MNLMATTQSFTWADAAGAAVVALAVVALVGFVVAASSSCAPPRSRPARRTTCASCSVVTNSWPRPPSTRSSARPLTLLR